MQLNQQQPFKRTTNEKKQKSLNLNKQYDSGKILEINSLLTIPEVHSWQQHKSSL